jgi:hypothetical protein
MTDPEKIQKLAEWMGWTTDDYGLGGDPIVIYTEKGDVHRFDSWSPLTRIQDATMLEDEVERRGLQAKYVEALLKVLRVGLTVSFWDVAHATPEQRCAAILRLMEGGE